MITLKEFVWLCNRSSTAFWELIKGKSPMEARMHRNWMQRALTKYAKDHPGNGRPDDVQLRGVAHLAEIDKRLWFVFSDRECRRYTEVEKDTFEKHWFCAKHGPKIKCKAAFEAWLKAGAY